MDLPAAGAEDAFEVFAEGEDLDVLGGGGGRRACGRKERGGGKDAEEECGGGGVCRRLALETSTRYGSGADWRPPGQMPELAGGWDNTFGGVGLNPFHPA